MAGAIVPPVPHYDSDLPFLSLDLYVTPSQYSSLDRSPLLAQSFAGLPPTVLHICGLDPLRDETFYYDKVLTAAGVPTKLEL